MNKTANCEIEYIQSVKAIRERAQQIYELSLAGQGSFIVNLEQLAAVSDYVLAEMKHNYPDFKIPFHSRWGHFKVGGIDRVKDLNTRLAGMSELEKARAKLDLVLVSVLLDAGAGEQWRYKEQTTGEIYTRSEGLAIASLEMFLAGGFSSSDNPYQVDSKALCAFDESKLVQGFQISDGNTLTGISGRVALLQKLGKVLNNSEFFKENRPGNIIDVLIHRHGKAVRAENILQLVLNGFGDIWPGRVVINDVNLGDVWHYSLLKSADPLSSLVPFHKLSQWLTYSLIEPIMEAGIHVSAVENLTGLAEYRNGGLLIDKQLISLKDKENVKIAHLANSDLIIEWRALTIVLLDKIAEQIRIKTKMSAAELPLAKVLEGGTWWAGRRAAKEKRMDGSPPLKLASDGTVF